MSTEKHKTVLEIDVEDRLLRRFGDTMRRVFSTEPIEQHRRAQEKVTQEFEKQRRIIEQLSRPRDSRGRYQSRGGGGQGSGGGGQGGGGGGGQPPPRQPLGFWGTAGATAVGTGVSNMLGRGGTAAAALAGGTGATRTALGAIPFVGPALQAAVQAAESLTDMAVGAGQARAMTAGQTGLGRVGGMNLAQFGISNMQAPGRLAALAQQSGMRGQSLRGLAPGAIELEALTGVGGGLMAGAMGAGGGRVTGAQANKATIEAIGSGLEAGIREARLGQYVQQMASDIEQLRNRGIMVDPRGLTEMTRMFGGTGRKGLQGMAAAGAARSMTDAVRGAPDNSDFFSALVMQTAMDQGMDPFDAKLALEENPEKFIPEILNRLGSMGGGAKAKAMALQKFIPGMSLSQAYAITQAAETGELNNVLAKGGAADRGQGYVDAQRDATKGAFGLAEQSARLQNAQIAGGGEVAGGIMNMRRREVKFAKRGAAVGSRAADFASGVIENYSDALSSDDPMGAVFQQLGKDMSMLFNSVTEGFQAAVDRVFEKIGGSNVADTFKQLSNTSTDEMYKAFKLALDDLIRWLEQKFSNFSVAGMLTPGG